MKILNKIAVNSSALNGFSLIGDRAIACAALALLTFSIGIVFVARNGPTSSVVSNDASLSIEVAGVGSQGVGAGKPAQTRLLKFEDTADGSVVVSDFTSSQTLQVLQPGTGAFLRGVVRALTRERTMRGMGAEQPFELAFDQSTGLILTDLATGMKITLNAFGGSNSAVFEPYLRGDNLRGQRQSRIPGSWNIGSVYTVKTGFAG